MLDAERFRQSLKAAHLSQAELARHVGVSKQTIARLATGGAASSRHLHKIARELKTTPAYLTGETDDPHSDIPDGIALSSEESELVTMMRGLAPKDRAAIMQLARTISSSAISATLHAPKSGYWAEE